MNILKDGKSNFKSIAKKELLKNTVILKAQLSFKMTLLPWESQLQMPWFLCQIKEHKLKKKKTQGLQNIYFLNFNEVKVFYIKITNSYFPNFHSGSKKFNWKKLKASAFSKTAFLYQLSIFTGLGVFTHIIL